jgi:type I restriction enzyme M protein
MPSDCSGGWLRSRHFLGLKFRRQHPVGPYIVDFYCAERGLAVELDGGQHFTIECQAYDQRRTDYLAMRGVSVLRFANNELFENTDGVLEIIRQSTGP